MTELAILKNKFKRLVRYLTNCIANINNFGVYSDISLIDTK